MKPTRDKFVSEMGKKFSEYLNSDNDEIAGYAEMFVYGSQQYEIESEAMAYVEKHPNATARELYDFFCRTAPEGLAPGDSGEDLLDD